nr:hypothetical protein Iba_chr11cCG11020 [Ipomoea batatas]
MYILLGRDLKQAKVALLAEILFNHETPPMLLFISKVHTSLQHFSPMSAHSPNIVAAFLAHVRAQSAHRCDISRPPLQIVVALTRIRVVWDVLDDSASESACTVVLIDYQRQSINSIFTKRKEEICVDQIRGVHVQMGWAELGRENGRHCRDVSGEIADWLRERRPSLAMKLDIEADEIENEEEWDWVFRD